MSNSLRPHELYSLPGSFVLGILQAKIISVQLLSCVCLFVTPWNEAHQASLSIANSQSLLKLMSIASVMPSNHLIVCHPFLLLPSIFPSIREIWYFPVSQFFTSGGQSIGASASASVLPMNIWDWFPLGLTGLISLPCIAIMFSRGFPWFRAWTKVSYIAGRFLTLWTTREAHWNIHQFSSVQSLSCVRLFATPWTAACQASLSITNFRRLLKLMSIESVMPSNQLILSCPLLLLPSIFPSIIFSNESALHIKWPTY